MGSNSSQSQRLSTKTSRSSDRTDIWHGSGTVLNWIAVEHLVFGWQRRDGVIDDLLCLPLGPHVIDPVGVFQSLALFRHDLVLETPYDETRGVQQSPGALCAGGMDDITGSLDIDARLQLIPGRPHIGAGGYMKHRVNLFRHGGQKRGGVGDITRTKRDAQALEILERNVAMVRAGSEQPLRLADALMLYGEALQGAGRRAERLAETVTVNLPGGQLVVSWRGNEAPVWMKGPAIEVFQGTLDPDDLAATSHPQRRAVEQ